MSRIIARESGGGHGRTPASALIGGVAFGLAFGAIAWSRTMIGLIAAAARGLLPLRLWTFFDWACEARLLRISGAIHQVRHRELQDFLTLAATTEDDQPGGGPRDPSSQRPSSSRASPP